MTLSIITISKIFDIHFRETINSINNSLKKNELINDLEVISVISKGNKSEVSKYLDNSLNCRTTVIIGEDSSIYNAMNIGVKHSSYKFVWFVNSGDFLHKNLDLENFISKLKKTKYDFISYAVINTFFDLSYLRVPKLDSTPHQGFICLKDFYVTSPLDEKKVTSDHIFMQSIVKDKKLIGKLLDQPIAEFNNYGLTSLPKFKNIKIIKHETSFYKIKFIIKAVLCAIIGDRNFIIFINEIIQKRKKLNS